MNVRGQTKCVVVANKILDRILVIESKLQARVAVQAVDKQVNAEVVD